MAQQHRLGFPSRIPSPEWPPSLTVPLCLPISPPTTPRHPLMIGCGIDYRRGAAFFTFNGKLMPQSEVALPLQHCWAPLVGASGGEVRVHLCEGGRCGGRYEYDLLQREEGGWEAWCSDYAMRRLFEEQHDPSTLTLEAERGWPWDAGVSLWERRVLEHCTPWLAQKRSNSRERVLVPSHRAAEATKAHVQAHVHAGGRGHGEDGGLWAAAAASAWPVDLPALVALTESGEWHLDALAVTAEDVMALACFLAEAGLPSWAAARLGSQGVRLALLQSLPMACIAKAFERAGLPVGLRVKLKRAIRCTFGTPLPMAGLSLPDNLAANARRRVFALPMARSMVVLLSPGLPCRSAPSFDAPISEWKRVGELVVAVAMCDGFLELVDHPNGRRALWALQDGRRVGQAGPLLRYLHAGDVTSGGCCLDAVCSAADAELLVRNQAAAVGGGFALPPTEMESMASRRSQGLGPESPTSPPPAGFTAPETPRWSTLARSGQLVREREMAMLLELARLHEPAAYLRDLLAAGASVQVLTGLPLNEVHAMARRVGMPLGHRMRFANAVHAHLHRKTQSKTAISAAVVPDSETEDSADDDLMELF